MAIHVMLYLKKVLRTVITLCVLMTLMGCPGTEDCNDFGSIAEVPNLIMLTPEQSIYTVGDDVILKLEIPAINTYYGSEMDLYDITGDNSARLVLGFNQLFLNNTLIFIKGSQSDSPNWFNMPYNSSTKTYELEVKIIFEQIGGYSFFSSDSVQIEGDDQCNRFFLTQM